MSISYNYVKARVHKKVEVATIANMVQWCGRDPEPHLWNYPNNHREYIEMTIYLMFYKAVHATGYGDLKDQCHEWYPRSQDTYKHNVQEIRLQLFNWSKYFIELGSMDDWEEAGHDIKLSGKVKRIHFRADSADFRTIGPPGAGGTLQFVVF